MFFDIETTANIADQRNLRNTGMHFRMHAGRLRVEQLIYSTLFNAYEIKMINVNYDDLSTFRKIIDLKNLIEFRADFRSVFC